MCIQAPVKFYVWFWASECMHLAVEECVHLPVHAYVHHPSWRKTCPSGAFVEQIQFGHIICAWTYACMYDVWFWCKHIWIASAQWHAEMQANRQITPQTCISFCSLIIITAVHKYARRQTYALCAYLFLSRSTPTYIHTYHTHKCHEPIHFCQKKLPIQTF